MFWNKHKMEIKSSSPFTKLSLVDEWNEISKKLVLQNNREFFVERYSYLASQQLLTYY